MVFLFCVTELKLQKGDSGELLDSSYNGFVSKVESDSMFLRFLVAYYLHFSDIRIDLARMLPEKLCLPSLLVLRFVFRTNLLALDNISFCAMILR